MAICPNCGSAVSDSAKFCGKCGTKLESAPAPAAPQPQAAPAPQPLPPLPFNFSRIPVRYRCPAGHVFDGAEGQTTCPTCGADLPRGGLIQIYRMGSFSGMAVGMGVYIDDVPCGHLGNKQSIRISVPYGAHKIHMTHTTTRACNDPIVNITPEYPYVWCKAHFAAAGFRIQIDFADPSTMPTA